MQEQQHQQPAAEAADVPHAEGSTGSLQERLAGAAGEPTDPEHEHGRGRDSRPHSAHSASSHRPSSSLGPSASASPQHPSSPTRQLSAHSQRGSEAPDPGPPALAAQRSAPVVPPFTLPANSPFTMPAVEPAAARREVRAPSPLPEELEIFTAVYGSHREVSSAGPTPRTTIMGMGPGSNPGTGPGMLPAWGPGAARMSIAGTTVSGQAGRGGGPVVGPFAERLPQQGISPGEPGLGSGKRSALGSSSGRHGHGHGHAHGTVHHGSPGHWAAGRGAAGSPAGHASHVPSAGFKPHGARTPPTRGTC